jgi:hypothetical protein
MSLVDAGSGRFIYRVEAKHIGWRRKVTLYDTCNMSDDQWAHGVSLVQHNQDAVEQEKRPPVRGLSAARAPPAFEL